MFACVKGAANVLLSESLRICGRAREIQYLDQVSF